MEVALVFGYISGLLAVTAYIPQIIRSWRTKSTKDISLWTWVIVLINFICGLVYSLSIGSNPFIIKYIFCLCALFILIYQKIRWG